MHARHMPDRQFQQVLCALLRQQYLPDRGLLSCAEDPTTVYCSPVTGATIPANLLSRPSESSSVSRTLRFLPRSKVRADPVECHNRERAQGAPAQEVVGVHVVRTVRGGRDRGSGGLLQALSEVYISTLLRRSLPEKK
jgi:hypothetical protein